MWKFRELEEGEPERSPHEAEFFNVGDLDASAALVREAIQNSLDAKLDSNGPIRVVFTLGSEKGSSKTQYYSELLSHVQSCDFKLNTSHKSNFTFLVIEDFGTRGLDGPITRTEVSDGQKSNYYNLWWREGISKKEGRDAGRWGLGKTVFFVCSELRSFWGLTIRQDDKRELLLGKALLKAHKHEGVHFDYYGYYCVGENHPIEDKDQISSFKTDFQIKRNDESGLSIIIPFPVADITQEALKRAVIQHYFYSIIRGILSVEINENGDKTLIDAKTIFDFASKLDWKETSWERHSVSSLFYFVYNSVHANESSYFLLKKFELPKIVEDHFGDTLESVRKTFEEGKLVSFKIPIIIKTNDGKSIDSYFCTFFQKAVNLPKAEEYYIRSGISISEIKMIKSGNIRALLTAEDEAIARFLGDSESPAHTDWKERTENFKEKYQNAVSTLRYVRSSLREISRIIDIPAPGIDPDFLQDIFNITEKEGTELGATSKTPVPPVDLKREGIFTIASQVGGFKLALAKKDSALPIHIKVEVAYDTKKGNPFNRYDQWDFTFDSESNGNGKIAPSIKGGRIIKVERNKLLLAVDNPKFELKSTGFDQNRDLVVGVYQV